MQILQRLNKLCPQLPADERALAEAIIANYIDAGFLPIDRLASKFGVNPQLIQAVLRKLDCNFAEFQKTIQKQLHQGAPVTPNQPDLSALLSECLDMQLDNVHKTYAALTPALAAQALHAIQSANRIYIIGMRSSFSLAYALHHGLNQILGNCELVTNSQGTLIDKILDISSDDLLIAICLPRYSQYTVELFKTLKEERQVNTIAITDAQNSPLLKHTDILLPCFYNSLSFHNAQTGCIFLIDFLITATAGSMSTKTKLRLSEAESILEKLKVHLQ